MEKIVQNWDKILDYVCKEYDLSKLSFDVWLKPLSVYSFDDHVLTLLTPTSEEIVVEYLRKKYSLIFKVAVGDITGIECEICFVTPEGESESTEKKKKSKLIEKYEGFVNPSYTFDSFIVGANNNFAYNAALAVAETPGIYNPLYLYSDCGMGKTHLLHAIVNMIRSREPHTKVFYTTSMEFTSAVIDSIRHSSYNGFRYMFADIDVFLIEDIQFLIGKEATQGEVAYILNELYYEGKQIILTADRTPKELDGLNRRIQSSCEDGLIADISAPDYAIRMEFLKKTQQERGYMADEQVLDYIAKNVSTNFRELNAALTRVCMYAKMCNKELNLKLAKEALKIFVPN